MSKTKLSSVYNRALAHYFNENFTEAKIDFKLCRDEILANQLLQPENFKKYQSSLRKVQSYIADCEFETANFEVAFDLYYQLQLAAMMAFTKIMSRDLDFALKICEQSNYSPACKWNSFLVRVLLQNEKHIANPGYLCFRLFAELTIAYFIRFNLKDYLNIMLGVADDLMKYYPEYNKAIGSAFLSCGKYYEALEIFNTDIRKSPNDAESYFKLAQVHLALNNKKFARKNFENTLKFLPGHIASQKYLKILS
jgi:tetratricopeptide (TPR) repeat protein